MSLASLLKFDIQPVKGLRNAYISATGDCYSRSRKHPNLLKLRKPYKGKVGYYVTTFMDMEGVESPRYYHRMVAETFLPKRQENHEVRHLDGNRLNNNVHNLAWGTRLENVADTRRHGRLLRGEKSPSAKLTEEDVRVIRYLHKRGCSLRSIGAVFKVTAGTIKASVSGITWSCVSDVENPLAR